MTFILDAPNGPDACQVAACHELKRRLGRKFHRNIVVAFEEWRRTGTFSLETMVDGLNEAETDELIAYWQLIQDQECDTSTPVDPTPYPFIAYGENESEVSYTTMTFTENIKVSFTAVSGIYYRIDYSFELETTADEDNEGECTIEIGGGGQTQIGFAHHKNYPYADRWNDMSSGYKFYLGTLSGAIDLRINYRNGYGAGTKKMRRARIAVTRVDPTPP